MCMHAGSDEALRKMVGELFKADASTAAVELQQRAVEYYVMTNTKDYHATLRSVMDQMPEFPNRESKLEKNLEEAVGETADAAVVKRDRASALASSSCSLCMALTTMPMNRFSMVKVVHRMKGTKNIQAYG